MGYLFDYTLFQMPFSYRPVIYPIHGKLMRSHVPFRKRKKWQDYISKQHTERCRSCLSQHRKGRWKEDPVPITDTSEIENKE